MFLLQFIALGLGVGAIYAMLAQGLVLIYRGSGILNLAHGAMAMAGGYLYWQLRFEHGWSFALAFVVAVVFTALVGAAIHLLVMRNLRNASPLVRLIATLGVLSILEGLATVLYGVEAQVVPSALPKTLIHFSSVAVSADRIYLLAIAVGLTVVLWAAIRKTRFGIAMSAVAESERSAAACGWSPDLVATVTWAVGGGLAGVAGILIASITGLQATDMSLLVIPALGAALVGQFRSFPLTLLAGVVIGVGQSVISGYSTQPGLSDSLPFLVIVVILIVQGKALPLRSHIFERLPRLGLGNIRVTPIVISSAFVTVGILTFFPVALTEAVTVQFIAAVVLLSIVIVTGYAGQLSLAQFAMAGLGAWGAGTLVFEAHWPDVAALVVAVLGTIAAGVIFGLPALRTRGANLAVVTLGLGLAIEDLILNNSSLTGGPAGDYVGAFHLFGWSLDPDQYPDRYAIFCLIALVLACLMVATLRKSRSGRQMAAVRANERAAASMGVNVAATKLYAFAVASGLAGLGGVLLAFQNHTVLYGDYTPIASITAVGNAVIGGIGYVVGALLGSGFTEGAFGSWILDRFGSLDEWLVLISGVLLLVTVMKSPEGLAGAVNKQIGQLRGRLSGSQNRRNGRPPQVTSTGAADLLLLSRQRNTRASHVNRKRESHLFVRDLSVQYGGVRAVDNVTLEVHPGTIVGLIGPNGAGKTSFIDAVTGFASIRSGSIAIGEKPVEHLPAYRRARLGIGRTFQGLELLEDQTVLENLQTASDSHDWVSYFKSLVRPGAKTPLSPSTIAAIDELDLESILTQLPISLPHGRRRLVALARAIATGADVLLLDEPAAGLDETETAELTHLTRKLAQEWGLAILMVEHDMDMVMAACDRIVVLDFGQKIADGTPEEIANDPAVIAAYLGSYDPASGTSDPYSGDDVALHSRST
jgi:ABC-type branched-subunit amino acid transport system ATPase component/branched-subunit amino acid ABC-type transport system permease component